jgi:hypothetical protein
MTEMRTTPLYKRTAELQEALWKAEEAINAANDTPDEEEYQKVLEVAAMKALDAAEGVWENKIESCALYFHEQKRQAAAVKEEAKRLTARAKIFENRAAWIKDYLTYNLNDVGKKKVEGQLATVRIQKSPAAVVIEDEAKIPKAFRTAQPDSIDKRAILREWKAGKGIAPGTKIDDTRQTTVIK